VEDGNGNGNGNGGGGHCATALEKRASNGFGRPGLIGEKAKMELWSRCRSDTES